MKHLFDSSYVKPQHNYRVIQDENPTKKAVLDEALSRYEKELETKNRIYNDQINAHYQRIQKENDQVAEEKESKKIKQLEFKQEIEDQMKKNVSCFQSFDWVADEEGVGLEEGG